MCHLSANITPRQCETNRKSNAICADCKGTITRTVKIELDYATYEKLHRICGEDLPEEVAMLCREAVGGRILQRRNQ